MAYSDFTQTILEQEFQLRFVQTLTQVPIQPLSVSDYLRQTVERNLPLATAINTEKARSELLIAPILVELKTLQPQISLFSGTDFNVDADRGLRGRCDFLISKAPDQIQIRAPVAVICEAKKEDLNEAIPQCAAAMLAAQMFNQMFKQNQPIESARIDGCITTGSIWRFLRLEERTVTIDLNEIYLTPLEQLLGHLVSNFRLDMPFIQP